MSLKDRLGRSMRANLNSLLDRVSEFEADGGFGRYIDPLLEDLGVDAGPRPTAPRGQGRKTIQEYYANLEVPMGAPMDEVKESYRRLMRKYHPDKHSADPEMERLATELSQELTVAYQAIESYLKSGRY